MNILFTCGGTAGHVNPAVALAHIFKQRHADCKILFVGAKGGMENKLVPKEGFEIRSVDITNFHRSLAPKAIAHNFATLCNLQKSRVQAKEIIHQFQPDLVVGTGGYASFPVVKQAARAGIPTAIHESNAVPGLTTKALARVANRVLVGFEQSRGAYDCPDKVIVTGTPVRGEFFRYTKAQAREKLGITDQRPLLLSYWGSLGAQVMNGHIADFITKECYDGAPFHHLHGAGRDYAWLCGRLDKQGLKLEGTGIEVREYIYDMPLVMAAADLVLCRAGASTISELGAIYKPSILVPSPNVTANHQEKNARVLAEQGAAVLMLEEECGDNALYHKVDTLLRERRRLEEMSAALKEMAIPDAGEKIYQTLMQLIR